jgi:sigma-B regulation protein RsbU (phosphoserine phosphatase)
MPAEPNVSSGPANPQVPAAGSPQPRNGHRARFAGGFDRFWTRVTEGRELSELWSQFRRDAQSGYQFYQKDFRADEAPGRPKWKQFVDKAKALMWALLEKLTPARRVLLLVGVVLLILPSGGAHFGGGHHEFEFSTFNFQFWGGLALFVLLILEIADRVVMKRDLEIARDIQSWLLPSTPPVVPGLTIAFATRPANTVAGDYYDVFARATANPQEQKLLLAVADVAGKSIPAALLMATFQASLKTLSSTPCSLKDLVVAMNRYACCNSQGGLRFTTAFLGEYDPATRALNYINAGHNNPMVWRSSGTVERLDRGGLPFGIRDDASYDEGEISVFSGDWLVIFTDGLVEAVNQFGEEYGEARLLTVLQVNASMSPDLLLQRIIAEVNVFVGSTPQHDDITCMLIKVA